MKYKITCKNCKQSDIIQIDHDSIIVWGKNTYIISGRKRLDMQWGWQCFCGNNDLLSKQEKRVITDKADPDPQEISQILANIEPQKPKFAMEKL